VMSRKAWDSLSAEDQKIFRQAAIESNAFMRERWKALEDDSQRAAEAAGVTIVKDFDRKSFVDAMGEVYQQAIREPTISQLVERIRQMQ
jgi:TRAP-type C4-dicarboxylate transport system substrate-binding protein